LKNISRIFMKIASPGYKWFKFWMNISYLCSPSKKQIDKYFQQIKEQNNQ